ncbi:MAG: KH domain-containing protein [Candidatus Pacearchaeota archaeon]
MEEIFIRSPGKLRKLKNKIEKTLDISIKIEKESVIIKSKQENMLSEYVAKKIIEAIDFGFDFDEVVQLKEEDCMFEKINLKDYVRQSRLKDVLGRIIGKKGKAIRTLSDLSDCFIKIKGHNIAIIGKTEDVKTALLSLKKLIRGAPHSKVYAYLERGRRLRSHEEDLELKE